MKNRVKAILLAAGLTVSCFGAGAVYAEEATEGVSEQTVTADADAEVASGTYAEYYDTLMTYVASDLETLSAMTDDQLESAIADPTVSSALVSIYANWQSVKEELGAFVEVTDQMASEDGYVIEVISNVVYDGVPDKTNVVVTTTYDMATQEQSYAWEVNYPLSYLMGQAALNTLMGVAIVFLVLLFLSFLISQMRWIPELMDRRKKKEEPAKAAAPAPAPAAAVVEEEELVDDGELVAVIAAAIAASANTTTDGFVVRSIRKANRKNWQNA